MNSLTFPFPGIEAHFWFDCGKICGKHGVILVEERAFMDSNKVQCKSSILANAGIFPLVPK